MSLPDEDKAKEFGGGFVTRPVVVEVITTELFRDDGTEGSPHRFVQRFWTMDGRLLAENDPASKVPEDKEQPTIRRVRCLRVG